MKQNTSPEKFAKQGNPFVAAMLTWACFGLGHWYLGKKWKAAILFVLLSSTFVWGVAVSDRVFFPRETADYPLWLGALATVGGHLWGGLFYLGSLIFVGPGGNVGLTTHEVGWVASLSAGLLNLLAMVDAWDISLGKKG